MSCIILGPMQPLPKLSEELERLELARRRLAHGVGPLRALAGPAARPRAPAAARAYRDARVGRIARVRARVAPPELELEELELEELEELELEELVAIVVVMPSKASSWRWRHAPPSTRADCPVARSTVTSSSVTSVKVPLNASPVEPGTAVNSALPERAKNHAAFEQSVVHPMATTRQCAHVA